MPREVKEHGQDEGAKNILNEKNLLPAPESLKHAVDLAQDKYLPLPENPRFADYRARLLEKFLNNSEIFRHYWKKLTTDSRIEIFSALRGPAFENLIEVLEIDLPMNGETAILPSEEQLEFYEKNFEEYIHSFQWQNKQFFGFLHLLTYQQTLTLIKSENSLVGALIIKYCKPDISAALLNDFSHEKRSEIIQNFSRLTDLSSEEIQMIELGVRKSASLLPNFIWSRQLPEVEFWEKILIQTENADNILMNLEKTNKELYEKLSRFRFKLNDLPTLPSALIAEVFEKVDNEELAKAIVDVSLDVQKFALDHLPENRRQLIESQMLSLMGVGRIEKELAVKNLTHKFREVLV
jgi:hypothetical protein